MTDTISWWRTKFGDEEIRGITEAIVSEHISQGPITTEFENLLAQALGIPYVVATTSGSTAILMALMALGIQAGDEVIVPNRTWIATAHAPRMLGAKVVLVDVRPDIPVMDVNLVRKKITSRTRAIIPVHLNGRAVDLEQLQNIAKEYGLYVIEDAAQSFLSQHSGKYLGTESDVGCFSLSVAKLISTGQGGFVVTKDSSIYERLKKIRTHGVDDVIHCVYSQMGFNFRMTDLQASIGIAQLKGIQNRIGHIKKVYGKYVSELKQLPFLKLIPVSMTIGEIPIYVEVLCEERDRLVSFLASHGIQARPFYPDLDTADYLGVSGEFPNSRIFGKYGLVLPCGSSQPLENIDRVIEVLRSYGERYNVIGHYCTK